MGRKTAAIILFIGSQECYPVQGFLDIYVLIPPHHAELSFQTFKLLFTSDHHLFSLAGLTRNCNLARYSHCSLTGKITSFLSQSVTRSAAVGSS